MTNEELAGLNHMGTRDLLVLILKRTNVIQERLDLMSRVEQACWNPQQIGHC